MVIVYRSDTGFTREYAEMLARAEKLKVCALEEARTALGRDAEVLYMGPLMAGYIKGLTQAAKRFQLKAVCGVGMSPPQAVSRDAFRKANPAAAGVPLFYLQGGYAPEKLSWMTRRMVNAVTRGARKSLQAKGDSRTGQEQAMLDMLLKGGSFVAFRNLDVIRGWLAEQK